MSGDLWRTMAVAAALFLAANKPPCAPRPCNGWPLEDTRRTRQTLRQRGQLFVVCSDKFPSAPCPPF
jgi:hypothetical protein